MFNTSSPWVAHGYPTKRSFKHDKILIELGYEQNKRERTSDDPKEFYQRRFLKRTGRRPNKDAANKLPHVDINDSHGVKRSHVQVQRQNSFDEEYLRYYAEVSAYSPNPPREAWIDDRNDSNTVSTQTYPDATINSPRSNLRFKRPHSAQIIRSKLVTHCPICRPVSSSSNRPKSATGLVANRNQGHAHICRHVATQRQKEEQIRFSNFIRSCKVFQRPLSAQTNKQRHYTISASEQIHDDFTLQQYTKEDAVKHDGITDVEHVGEAERLPPTMVDAEKEEDDILYINEEATVKLDDEEFGEEDEDHETTIDVAVVTDVIITERESIEPEHEEEEKILRESVNSPTNQLLDSFDQEAFLDKDSSNKEEDTQEADCPETTEILPEISELPEDLQSSPKTPENSLEGSEKAFDSTFPPHQKVDIMSGQVAIAPPQEEILGMKLEEDEMSDDTSQNSNFPDPIAIVTHSYPPVEAVVVVAAREKLKLDRESQKDEDFPSDINSASVIPSNQTQESSDITDLLPTEVELPPSILKKGVASESRRPSEVRFASPEHVTSSESETEEQQIKTEQEVSEMKEEPPINEELLTLEDEEPAMEMTEKQAVEPTAPNIDLSKSELVVIGEANVSPTETKPPQVTMDTNQDVVKETKEKEVKVKPTKPPPAAVKAAPVPVVPKYIEPQSLELRKLLAPPDLSDFDIPWPDPPKPKEKKKKKLRGKRGKKKRKKKEAKPPLPPVDPKTFFTYDPNALSSLEMAEEHLAIRPREDPDMREIIDFVQAFNDRFKKEAKAQPWLHGRVALSRQICRFMLPIDLKQLQGLSACEYLQQYCMVCKRRTKLYTNSFEKQINKRKKSRVKDNTEKQLDYKELREAFKDVHVGMVTTVHIDTAFTLANVDQETLVPIDLFCALCALSERTLYSEFITEDTDINEYAAKELIENADFVGLQSKLEGLDIKDDLKALLLAI